MKLFKALNHLEEALSAVLLSAMTVLILLQIGFRFTGAPLSWTEELARYMFVWLIYMSCSYAIRQRAHIKVDVLAICFRERGKLVLSIFSNVAFFAFAVIISYYAFFAVNRLAFVNPQYSPALGVPMVVPYLSMFLGCGLMALRLVQDTAQLLRQAKSRKGGE